MTKVDVLIAHPLKHHVFPLAAGIQRSGLSLRLVTPFYSKGFGRLVSMLPGSAGRKAQGYHLSSLEVDNVISPLAWQVRRLLRGHDLATLISDFDEYVAGLIDRGAYRFGTLITLQDYMPKTVRAAKKNGALIWSDQILNQSNAACSRINSHYQALGWDKKYNHDESVNDEILGCADIVTVPSRYTAEGLKGRMQPVARLFRIPYGVDSEKFSYPAKMGDFGVVRVLARANNVRKGGHVLIEALRQCSSELMLLTKGSSIEVLIIGTLECSIIDLLSACQLPSGFSVRSVTVPHKDMPALLASSHLFVMPSLSESMSLICVEAMQCALPLVITPYCGIDGFEPLRMGVEVEDNVVSVAEGLKTAFKNIEQWPAWGEACRQAAGKLDWRVYEESIAVIARGLA